MKLLSDRQLFWDTDVSKIDLTKHKQAIVERVLERGSWDNIKELVRELGKHEVAASAKNARWFSDKTMHFVSGYFNIPLGEMRCYTLKQSSQVPYL
jgi:hypothetical protein